MTELESLIKLDILLKILQNQTQSLNFLEILGLVENTNMYDGKWLKMALYKLEKDGYVTELVNIHNNNDKQWLISIEGEIFHGYIEQKRINDFNQKINENAELARWRNDQRLVAGTWFAGIVALLLLLLQTIFGDLFHFAVHALKWFFGYKP